MLSVHNLRETLREAADEIDRLRACEVPEPLDALEPSGFYRMLCVAEDNGEGFVVLSDVFAAVSATPLDSFIPAGVWDRMGRPGRVRVELTAADDA